VEEAGSQAFRNVDPHPRRRRGLSLIERGKKEPGFFASLWNDTTMDPQSEMSFSTFRDFLTLGAGLSPAEGSLKPIAGFIFNCSCAFALGG
jgi:hypothetical protein